RPVRALLQVLGAVVLGDLVLLVVVNEFGRTLLEMVLAADTFGGLREAYAGYAVAAALYGVAQLLLFFCVALEHISLALLPAAVTIVQVPLFLANGSSIDDCVTIVQSMALLLVAALALVVLLPRLVRGLARRARDRAMSEAP